MKNLNQADKDQAKRAHDAHVDGKHKPGKQINHTAPLTTPDVKVRSLRPVHADGTSTCGERVPGSKPGETLVATNKITWTDTGKQNPGQTTEGKGILLGNKQGKQFLNKHMSGVDDKSSGQRVALTSNKNGTKQTVHFDETTCSSSAEVKDPYNLRSSSSSSSDSGKGSSSTSSSSSDSGKRVSSTSSSSSHSTSSSSGSKSGNDSSMSLGERSMTDSGMESDFSSEHSSWADESGFSESSSECVTRAKKPENEKEDDKKEPNKNSTQQDSKKESKLVKVGKIAAMSAAQVAVDIGDQALMNAGLGVSAFAGTEKGVSAAVENDLGGIRAISAGAGASVDKAYAGAKATPLGASAFAGASVAEASAEAVLIEGLAARAKASAYEANAGASAGVLGVQAGAGARVARAETGITNTPLQAHVEAVGAGAEAGVSLAYAGASAGAHLGEARAGPFAVRAGVRFGAGIRNGVPEIDMGPVTVPCCVM